MKLATLRPQAKRDRQDEARYYRSKASPAIARELVAASRTALEQLQENPGMGSPRIGQLLDIPGLRSWRVSGFPLIWFYFEREDCLDVVRLLGERQDILSILTVPKEEAHASTPAASNAPPIATKFPKS